ncbi:MAG: fasciclin domain-containing protein [Solirubrobacterales bacterium]
MKSSDTAMASASTDGTTVGGAKMVRTKDIVDNAVNADNVTTVVSLVKLAGLVPVLKGEGPFTVFAPNNEAFKALDPQTVASLQKPENKKTLAKILTYHVVPGTYTSADLEAIAKQGGSLKTVEGEKLTPETKAGEVVLKDAQGNTVTIQTADVISSNGVTHVIDGVLMP